jgi:uncharacterized protein (DUF488 family)
VKIYTIGFTKTTAEGFFTRLIKSGTKKLVDVRLNNVSQLAGFAKRDDLRYFTSRSVHRVRTCLQIGTNQDIWMSTRKMVARGMCTRTSFSNL